jgi:hypothetical protein
MHSHRNVDVPSHTSDTSTVGVSITTANGYTRETDLSGAGDLSYTFNIPENQGKSVQVRKSFHKELSCI